MIMVATKIPKETIKVRTSNIFIAPPPKRRNRLINVSLKKIIARIFSNINAKITIKNRLLFMNTLSIGNGWDSSIVVREFGGVLWTK